MDYLNDVPEGKDFMLGDKPIKNLYGLLFEFRAMTDETYNYYASDGHNYFADWVEHVILDLPLANSIRETRSRKEAIATLESSVESIRKGKESVTAESKEIEFHVELTPEKEEEQNEDNEENIEPETTVATPALPEEKIEKKLYSPIQEKKLEGFPKEEKDAKLFLWKHFGWEMAKEFMYGLAFGILIGLILAKMFFR